MTSAAVQVHTRLSAVQICHPIGLDIIRSTRRASSFPEVTAQSLYPFAR
jgi:hypothetical protein